MTKRLLLAILLGALLCAVPAGPAQAGKIYAASAHYEPSNAVLYRYEVSGPDDHRYEANPPGEVDEPELTLPIGQWPDNSPAALAVSPWHELFVFDRGPGGAGGAAGSIFRFLDPTGPAPVPNGRIVSTPEFSFNTPHFGDFRGNELFVAQRIAVVERFLFDEAGAATFNGQLQISGHDSPRAVRVAPWGEVFVGQLGEPPILRFQIAADGTAIPNGAISGCGISNPHDMVFDARGQLFVASGATSSVVRLTFDGWGNAVCAGAVTDGRLYSAIGITLAPWGELFVSTHLDNRIERWLVGPDGAATHNGTIHTPVGPVVSWVGTVRGLGDVEYLDDPPRETLAILSGDPALAQLDPSGQLRDPETLCTHRTVYPYYGPAGDYVTEPAYVVGTYHPYWDVIPGTSWINWYPSYGSPGMSYTYEDNYAAYERAFDLPAHGKNARLDLQYMGDDWVDVYLNGVQIVDQHSAVMAYFAGIPIPPEMCGYQCGQRGLPNQAVAVTDPALFLPGRNVLRFVQRDPDGAGGLDFRADVSWERDGVPPVTAASLSGTVGQGGWYTSPVTVTLQASDGSGTGVARTEYSLDATIWTAYAGPFQVAAEGTTVLSFRSVDRGGNVEAAQSATLRIDLTPPAISITSPAAGSAYLLRQPVVAAWSATDAVSGLASASGTVASGAAIDTATVGAKPFVVLAADVAGNAATASAGYAVQYRFGGVLPPLSAAGTSSSRLGAPVSVRFQLFDWAGAVVPTATARLFLAPVVNGVPGAERPATAQGGANVGNLFRFDPGTGQYLFILDTRPLAAGAWQLRIALDDGTSQRVGFRLTR